MKALDKIGLLKMDFLGLANLTMLAQGRRVHPRVARHRDRPAATCRWTTQLTYEMLVRGETHSVFQLEGSGMTRYVKELKPQSIRHLAAMVALYRPGPMAHIPNYIAPQGRAAAGRLPGPVARGHPRRELRHHRLPGPGAPDRAASGRLHARPGRHPAPGDGQEDHRGDAAASGPTSWPGAKERGYATETAEKLWEYIEPFAGYAFNKAHAFCYAFIAYQTAYLKANYPVEWMAAVLTTDVAKPEKIVSALGECRRTRHRRSCVPNINHSQVRFTVERVEQTERDPASFDRGIRFGLAAVKNVGEGAVEAIVAEREKNGPFKSLDDFCSRVDLRTVNKRVIESAGQVRRDGRLRPARARAGRHRRLHGAPASSARRPPTPARSTCSACSAAATTRRPTA